MPRICEQIHYKVISFIKTNGYIKIQEIQNTNNAILSLFWVYVKVNIFIAVSIEQKSLKDDN